MRKLIFFVVFMAMIPARLPAFTTRELLGLVAMPLAVAAVSDVAGVPQDQLADIVATLNQANVPPEQFVEVVRYVPVTYGRAEAGPAFAEFVQTEMSNGVTGPALVTSITRHLRTTYNVTPRMTITEPATTYVVERDYIPTTTTVVTAADPLELIALPLAVAAASEVSGIPQSQLADLVATLNGANVPVVQEIQVIRYAPVALTADNGQPFVEFVQTQVNQGITGPALVPVVTQRLQTITPERRIVFSDERRAVVGQPVVVEPVIVRQHPHGGPPGQIKKQLGLQTGAEVVHGHKRGRQLALPPMISSAPPARAEREHGHGHGRGHKDQVIATLALLLAFGCKQQSPSAAQTPVTTEQTAQAQSNLTPEQLGEIGAQIKKHPSDANKILAEHGFDQASFEKEIRKVASDPAASRRYRDAYKKSV
jgi:hypothetical protein